MKNIHPLIKAEALKVESTKPWIWCYKGVLEVSTSYTLVWQLTSFDEEITIPRGSSIQTESTDWVNAGANQWSRQLANSEGTPGWVYFGSSMTLGNEESSLTAVDADYDWYFDTATRVFTVYATSNPNTYYGDVEIYLKQTFYPFPVKHEIISQNSEGDIPQITLSFSNITRDMYRYLYTGEGMIGQEVRFYLAHYDHLTLLPLEWRFEVKEAKANDEVVTLTLELPNFYQFKVPWDVYSRDHCRWRYKDPATCGYIGDMPYCDKTLTGPKGCIEHGKDELANGRPVKHPRLFGGFPGIPPEVHG